jgi:hypothetical protein
VNRVLRAAVLAWAALLVLGAWPWRGTPLLGALSTLAWDALERLTVRPGMAIFRNSVGDEKFHALCQRVEAIRADGRREILYQPTCPPVGFKAGVEPFEVVMLRIARATPRARLLESDPDDARRLRYLEVRRYAAVGDYFCHSSLAGGGDYDEVTLAEQLLTVSYRDGRRIASKVTVCSWRCGQQPVPVPHCRLAPADDPSVALVGPAAR